MIRIHDPILLRETVSGDFTKACQVTLTADIEDIRETMSLSMTIRGVIATYFRILMPVQSIMTFLDSIPFLIRSQDNCSIKITCTAMPRDVALQWEMVDVIAQGTSVRLITAVDFDIRITGVVQCEKDRVFLAQLADALLAIYFEFAKEEKDHFRSMLQTVETGSEVTLILTMREN